MRNTRTLRDTILLVMGQMLPKTRVFIKDIASEARKIYTTTAIHLASSIRIVLYKLDAKGVMRDVDGSYSLTKSGISAAKMAWQIDIKQRFNKSWLTNSVVGICLDENPEPLILHDALLDAGASEEVCVACKNEYHSKWLIELISQGRWE